MRYYRHFMCISYSRVFVYVDSFKSIILSSHLLGGGGIMSQFFEIYSNDFRSIDKLFAHIRIILRKKMSATAPHKRHPVPVSLRNFELTNLEASFQAVQLNLGHNFSSLSMQTMWAFSGMSWFHPKDWANTGWTIPPYCMKWLNDKWNRKCLKESIWLPFATVPCP